MPRLARAFATSALSLALAAPAFAAGAQTPAAPPTVRSPAQTARTRAPAQRAERRLVTSGAAAPNGRVVLPTNVAPLRYDVSVKPDIAGSTFTGHVDIKVQVKQATRTVVLNAAELTFSKVSLSGVGGAPQVSFDADQQTATLTFPSAVAPGEHTLSIDYAGKINQHAAGLFSLAYDTPQGRKQALFTQFENSDARRFVPSWDEPNKKAVFQLTATVPSDLMPVSNMPVASTQDAGGGMKRVTFGATPKMSSYLLFFGLGDFERIHQDVDGVDVGVVFKRGDRDQATYALDAATHILRYYNNYFGVKFPLPKLDMIAGPGQSQFFGAMENWGAIFYFERDLLIDPKTSTEGDKQNVYLVVAHEMAHQWFGDLVTMDWWDDLWLNEGFASWMEYKATSQFHPEWKLELQSLGAKEAAMGLDSRAGTHPIITPIRDVLQAQQAFDTITYEKGQAVIGMLESYVGPDVWRAGVRRYIKAHAYGNSVTDDLWREVDAVSPKPITQIAHDFTLQPGVPLIREGGDGSRLTLSQGRFGVDAASKAPLTWHVPVVLASAGAPEGSGKGDSVIVSGPQPSAAPKVSPPVVVNAGQAGYFRTAYTPAAFSRLLGDYGRLSSADQVGLASDAYALGMAGDAPVSQILDLTGRVPADADPVVWSRIVGVLASIDALFDGRPDQAAYRAYARSVVEPVFARVGWDKTPGEADNVALLRASVISALGEFDDPQVVAEARRRFEGYVKDPSSLSPATRRTVLGVVARHADAAAWEELHQLARTAPTALTKDEYYNLLSVAQDPALAQRALDLAISGEPEATEGPTMIRIVGGQHADMAFDFYVAHLDQVNAVLEPDSRNQFAPRLAGGAKDAAFADKLQAFADAHIPATARGEVAKALSALRYRAEVRRLRTPEIAQWVARHGTAQGTSPRG